MEDLTLPEPARTLLGRIRATLDAYVIPCTPARSGWQMGGGIILAARWRHRESLDIDLLVHPRTETRFLHPEAAPELHRRLEAAGARKITFGRFSQILFDESRIEMLAADPHPQVGHGRAINAVLAAAGTDPERIRRETAAAMRKRENRTILELGQDRAGWGW